jgi:single-strand DNA-binding protein
MLMSGVVRVGNDAQVRHTPQGDVVVELSLAFNYGKREQDGKRPTQWIKAAFWGSRAEKLLPYMTKGSQVHVVLSEPHIETYDKKDGSGQATSLRARVMDVELIGGRSEQTLHEKAKADGYQPQKSINNLDDDIPF